MPRRRKTGQSPARVPDRPPEGRKNVVVYPVPLGPNRAMENNFAPSGSLSSSTKEQIAESMQEMFSHLDPEVIDIVLSECDFKGRSENEQQCVQQPGVEQCFGNAAVCSVVSSVAC